MQDRWPRGTPVAPSGRGPGGGRFRGDWASIISGRVRQIRLTPSLAQSLESGVVHVREFKGGHSDASVIQQTYADGTFGVRKDFVDNWQGYSAEQQADAEEAASILGRAIGVQVPEALRRSPTTTIHRYLEGQLGGEWTQGQEMEERRSGRHATGIKADLFVLDKFERENKAGTHPDRVRLGLFDMLINNVDRDNPANWVVSEDGTVAGFDHAGAFQYEMDRPGQPGLLGAAGPFAKAFVAGFENPKWKTNPLTKADAVWLRQQVDSVRPEFERLGRLGWWEQVSARLDGIAAKARGTENIFVGVVDGRLE